MSEIEEIKARAKERRDFIRRREAPLSGKEHSEAETDLDHAITIAEHWKKQFNFATEQYGNRVARVQEVKEERDQARADVLKLRDALKYETRWDDVGVGEGHRESFEVLADTEHYETYR